MAAAKNKNLIISLDPGFDSLKVVTDGRELFKISKEVIDITGKEFLGLKDDNYIQVNYMDGKSHLVGACAAKYLAEIKGHAGEGIEEQSMIADTFATFQTKEKEILMMAGIGMALIRQAENGSSLVSFNDLDDENGMPVKEVVGKYDDLYIGVAMPHDALKTHWGYIQSWLKGHHEYSIVNSGIKYVIKIDTNKLYPQSQVVLALIGAISDDRGQINMSANTLTVDDLPAIVIDGGYLTLGKFYFTSVQSVEDGESNTEYAMKKVYDAVAEIIKEEYNRPEFTGRKVKSAAESNKKVPYIDKNGKSGRIDVPMLIKEQVRIICTRMIDEFRSKYNNLLDMNAILVTGGTGYVYYETIKELLKDYDWLKIILTDYEFEGEQISPEFAISVGLYKALYHQAEKEHK